MSRRLSMLEASGYEILIFLGMAIISCVIGLVVPPSMGVSPRLLAAGCVPALVCAVMLNAPLWEDTLDRLAGPFFLVREQRGWSFNLPRRHTLAHATRPPLKRRDVTISVYVRSPPAARRCRSRRRRSYADTPFGSYHTRSARCACLRLPSARFAARTRHLTRLPIALPPRTTPRPPVHLSS